MNKPIILTPSAFEQIKALEKQVHAGVSEYTDTLLDAGVITGPFMQIMDILYAAAGEEADGVDGDLERAKHLITLFLINEYATEPEDVSLDDLTNIGLAYTEFGERGEYPVQVTANLVDCTVTYTILSDREGICRGIRVEEYRNLWDMNRSFLNCLSFDDLVSEFADELEEDRPCGTMDI